MCFDFEVKEAVSFILEGKIEQEQNALYFVNAD